MKKIVLVFCAALFALVVASFNAAAEDCCVLHKEKDGCTFWNMTGYYRASDYCAAIDLLSINIDDHAFVTAESCATFPYNTSAETELCWKTTTKDILEIPEFTTIAAGLALAGASAGYIYVRRKKVR